MDKCANILMAGLLLAYCATVQVVNLEVTVTDATDQLTPSGPVGGGGGLKLIAANLGKVHKKGQKNQRKVQNNSLGGCRELW